MDRVQLAGFLRARRELLQPEDVGLPRGPRRRTHGLRREEIAALGGMSADYYTRLEQQRGPRPSAQMLAALARGLRLTLDERDHLFRLGGYAAPARSRTSTHVPRGMLRIADRLQDTPAMIMNGVGETLLQTPMAKALLGDDSLFDAPRDKHHWRWFVTGEQRRVYPVEDHDEHSRVFVSDLRRQFSLEGGSGPVDDLVERLRGASAEFAALWERHEVVSAPQRRKRLLHPELGELLLDCQILTDPDQNQTLLVFTADPGPESDKLDLLRSLAPRPVTV